MMNIAAMLLVVSNMIATQAPAIHVGPKPVAAQTQEKKLVCGRVEESAVGGSYKRCEWM